MEHQESHPGNDRRNKSKPTGKQPTESTDDPIRKRDQSVKKTSTFSGARVAAGVRSATPAKSPVEKAVAVATSPVRNLATSSEVTVRLEKTFKIRIGIVAGKTHVSGELHLVPWEKCAAVVDGVRAVVADVLKLELEAIEKESDLPAMPDGTARPAYRLRIPRTVSDDEQRILNIAFESFRRRLRGLDESLTKDIFNDANPEAEAAGNRAAEDVRRKAGGRAMPLALAINAEGRDASSVNLEGRIAEHPDPERDEDEFKLCGVVVGILTEKRKVWLRCFKYRDSTGEQVSSSRGKLFVINYSDQEHKGDVLKLPLGTSTLVNTIVIPRVGRNKDRLILKSFHHGAATGDSSTTR